MNHEKTKQIIRIFRDLVKNDPHFTVNEVRIIVALERAIARLLRSRALEEHLIFKGGFVLLKTYQSLRFTRDGDALAVSIDKEKLKHLVSQALTVDLDDGLWFGDIQIFELEDQGRYGAYRFDCAFQVGKPDLKKIHKLSRVHIDVGFSDQLPMKPPNQIMPSVLEKETPVSWKVYPMEYIIAEKLETLYDRGSANSRAKDIYDLIHLIPRCADKKKVTDAIKLTFKNRETLLPTLFVEKADEFDKTILRAAWPGIKVFRQKLKFDEAWEALRKQLKDLDEYFQKSKS